MSEDDDALTSDTLLRGRVRLIQPARGFRSSLDPVLLAAFARPPFGRFLDIGCGTGAVSFLLLARDPEASGENSMRWYRAAVGMDGGGPDAGQRQRLLEYNEDDVRATMTLRRWMSSPAINDIPYVGDL